MSIGSGWCLLLLVAKRQPKLIFAFLQKPSIQWKCQSPVPIVGSRAIWYHSLCWLPTQVLAGQSKHLSFHTCRSGDWLLELERRVRGHLEGSGRWRELVSQAVCTYCINHFTLTVLPSFFTIASWVFYSHFTAEESETLRGYINLSEVPEVTELLGGHLESSLLQALVMEAVYLLTAVPSTIVCHLPMLDINASMMLIFGPFVPGHVLLRAVWYLKGAHQVASWA